MTLCLPYFDPSPGQFWTDPRLSFERSENLEKLVVGAEYIKLIWVPDTFFVNEKIALFHQVKIRMILTILMILMMIVLLQATTENQFLRIMHTGEILRSMRLTIKVTILVSDWSTLNNTGLSLH